MAEKTGLNETVSSEITTEESTQVRSENAQTKSDKNVAEDLTQNQSKEPPRKIDNFERALRTFKRNSAGIISEVRQREAYVPPSLKRKRKSERARKNKHKRSRHAI